jgi:hypothetical protein
MDADRFDALTRAVVTSASRRGLLGGLASAAASLLLSALGGNARARDRQERATKPCPKGHIRCGGTRCYDVRPISTRCFRATYQHVDSCSGQTRRSNFIGETLQADRRFFPKLDAIDDCAAEYGVKVYITDSYRPVGRIVNGIVKQANCSNHAAGHAIDMNVQYKLRDGTRKICNSDCLGNPRGRPQAVSDFLQCVKNAGLRWGGDFSPKDPVHFDDNLNADKSAWAARVRAVANRECSDGQACCQGFCRQPCPGRQQCCGAICCPDSEECGPDVECRPKCGRNERRCCARSGTGSSCCPTTQACCGDICCPPGEECGPTGRCRIKCKADERRCPAGQTSACCPAAQACCNGWCCPPGESCGPDLKCRIA